MSVVLIEGFDTYNGTGANTGLQSKWPIGAGGSNVSLVAGRFGGQAVRCAQLAGTNWIDRPLPAAYASLTVGFAMRFTVMPTVATAAANMLLSNGTTAMVGIQVMPTGAIEAGRYTGSSAKTVLGTTSAGIVGLNIWHYVECELVISDTVGEFRVYVDGNIVLTLSSVDTRNGTPIDVNSLRFGTANNSTNGGGTCEFDDVYVDSAAARLGERRVETLYPTADTAQKDWTASAGASNAAVVGEAQVSTADFVQASTIGNTDRYLLGDLSSVPTTIDAIQIGAFAQKTDGASRAIALQLKSGATTSDGPDFALAASYARFERMLAVDPNTSGPWSAAAVDALEIGLKVTV